jgi:hypothetical protein
MVIINAEVVGTVVKVNLIFINYVIFTHRGTEFK